VWEKKRVGLWGVWGVKRKKERKKREDSRPLVLILVDETTTNTTHPLLERGYP
jgi:hypothetical protein